MNIDEFDYQLPESAIAQVPLLDRSSSRLLVDLEGQISHCNFWDFPSFLNPGDVIVLNDTRVRPARLLAQRPTGGKVEVLLLEPSNELIDRWEALVKPSRKVLPGTVLTVNEGFEIHVHEDLGGGRRIVEVSVDGGLLEKLQQYGKLPLPPYFKNCLEDPERYQTVYARRSASAASPTAGLHFTTEIFQECEAAGARIEYLELVVGLDTFRPVTVVNLDEHQMHSEAYVVSQSTMEACLEATRVIAVGTTTLRALESAALGALSGRTDLFIRRPFPFQIVDLLLTNFHLPRSTLLLMLDAFIGPRWHDLYALALKNKYRFLSFGDAMLVDRMRELR
tara:strand:- start:482 stop:1489 length:1008 start_codon:yes stop_codon:yes gene_type:complete